MGTTASNLAPAGVADLEPDTRGAVHSRAGHGRNLVASKSPATFGSIFWSDGKAAVWHLELRRICLSTKRELQSRIDGTASGLPCQYCSPLFHFPGLSDELSMRWQLSLVPLEVSRDSVSLYVQSLTPQDDTDSGVTVIASFSLTVKSCQKAWDVSSCVASTDMSWKFGPGCTDQGVRQVILLKDLKQLEQSGHAEVELKLASVQVHTARPVPGIITCTDPHIILISLQPRILLIDNFLPAADCQRIINLAWPDLQRSRVAHVYAEKETCMCNMHQRNVGDTTISRTSSSTFFTRKANHPDIQSFEQRVSQLISLPAVMHGRRPLTKGEAVQVVRYQPGEFYAEHFDNKADDCSKRACTIMAYLSDVDAGGETYFRRSNGCPVQALLGSDALPTEQPNPPTGSQAAAVGMSGLRIPPKQGRAIMFWSRAENGQEDRASLHSGERVQQGEKWIASRWLQEQAVCSMDGPSTVEE